MWKTKRFKTRENMLAFIEKNDGKIEFHEVFVNNAWAIEYRNLRKIGWGW